jgi:hypothetical protein
VREIGTTLLQGTSDEIDKATAMFCMVQRAGWVGEARGDGWHKILTTAPRGLLVGPALAPSCPGGAACSSVPAGHAVEVVLLRLEPREEAVRNEAARAGGHVEGCKAGQRLAASHAGDAAALQLLLPQQSTDLTVVHLRINTGRYGR